MNSDMLALIQFQNYLPYHPITFQNLEDQNIRNIIMSCQLCWRGVKRSLLLRRRKIYKESAQENIRNQYRQRKQFRITMHLGILYNPPINLRVMKYRNAKYGVDLECTHFSRYSYSQEEVLLEL
jgi:predicted enzyme involved in methoxymalonyl-ACP biosynthesis